MSSDTSTGAQLNNSIENLFTFDENFLITLTKDGNKSIERKAKLNCKILKITLDFYTDEVFATLSALDPVEYPSLFIFFIEIENLNFFAEFERKVQESFVKFVISRPLIIKIKKTSENSSKFYYKAENSTKIIDIDQQFSENLDLYEEWQNKLRFLVNGELGTIESEMLKKLSYIRDSSIILRFLRTLNLQEASFGTLVLEIAKNGTKKDLLAVLDAPFEDGRILNSTAQDYLVNVFEGDESGSESSDESNLDEMEESDSENPSDEQSESDQDEEMSEASSESNKKDSDLSVLLTAIEHSNKEVIDYLITYWSHLIQQLPFKHQVRICTAAFETNQLDVMCDLLEISDFPFPHDFESKKDGINNGTLLKITGERTRLKVDIKEENLVKIGEFIDSHSSLKIVYDSKNQSLMKRTVDLKKYSIYFYLKSHGFHATEFNCLEEILDEKEMEKANKQATKQRIKNTNEAISDRHSSIYWLCTKSRIHNRKITKEEEAKCRKYIKKWYEDIHKVAPELLDVAASCENLKIIFDFESKMVDRVAFRDNFLGLAFDIVESTVFVGAKLGDKKREQEIKGTLAHELCHYVMSLVFDNHFLPYYQYDAVNRDKFDGILKKVDKWSSKDSEHPDDECDGIISTVFTCYESKCFHLELIVRAVHILTLYDDDSEKSSQLQKKYKILFNFWDQHVLSELLRFNLSSRNAIRNFNKTFGLLSRIQKQKLELSVLEYVKDLTENKLTIISTNTPTLLFINIHKQIETKFGYLYDAKFIFSDSEQLCDKQVLRDFKKACKVNQNVNVVVDCTKVVPDCLRKIFVNEDFNFIFVVSNADQYKQLLKICEDEELEVPIKKEMNYSWNDLTAESQKMLLETKISFQNNSEVILLDLIEDKIKKEATELKKNDFGYLSEITDDQILNLLVDKQEIKINQMLENDQSEKHFQLLFCPRSFVRKREGIRISQERLLLDTQGKRFVLLSDIAGTGKSWVMKNLANLFRERNPTRWVTYVDLKQFIEEFKEQKENPNFSKFIIENVLKPKDKFEGEIFKKLYKSGKVCIIFDGFDEIAPDCAEFVAKLAKTFEFNGGNQLWIATRDYFEVDLQKTLQTDFVYKLFQLTEEEGIDFIVASCVLKDLNNIKIISRNDFENIFKSSPNLETYRQKAEEIIRKITISQNRSVGLPQLFSMIAESFKESKNIELELKGMKIYENFTEKHYKRWSYEKGQLRINANIRSQQNVFNFWKFHQICAIKSLFPEFLDFLFPGYDNSEWTVGEIIACGLMSKKGGKFFFIHETFREFFVADFIAKALKTHKIDEKIFELFITILTIKKYEVIRMFLNDVIDESVMEKIRSKMATLNTKFHGKEIFSELFTKNLEKLANLFIKLFKSADYEDVRNIFCASIENVIAETEEQKMFLKFQEFMFESLKVDDLKQIINEHRIFHKIVESRLEIEVFETFVMETLKRTDRQFVRQELKLMDENILRNLLETQNFSAHKVQRCFEIIQKFLIVAEIFELIEDCDSKGRNILQICLKEEDTAKFEILWMQIQNFYSSQQLSEKFKELVKQKDLDDENLLHIATFCGDLNFFETFWELLLKTFENTEELKNLIIQNNKWAFNFIFLNVVFSQPEITEFTFKSLKENFTESQYHEILGTRGEYNRNLLQLATIHVKQAEIFQMLWMDVKTSCKSNKEFLKIIKEGDEDCDNIFNIAAYFTTGEIFEFMEAELAKIASKEEIRKIVKNLNKSKRNLLHQAAFQNKSLELHEVLWKVIRKYFDSIEILEFIKHLDVYGHNLLIIVTVKNTKEIKELTWIEVKDVLNRINCEDKELNKNIEQCDKIIENAQQSVKLEDDEKEVLKLKWIKIENPKLFDDSAQLIIKEKLFVKTVEDLILFMAEASIKNHQMLWDHLLKIYKRTENLKNLLTEKNKNGNNFIHLLVIWNKADVIEFTFEKLKENFSESQFQKILRSKGEFTRNLLQQAAVNSKELETHQVLWKLFQNACKSSKEFLEILEEVDENGYNVFSIAAAFTTGEIFKFMEAELAKIASRDGIRKLLKNLTKSKRNLLQSALQNEHLELHKGIWKVLKKYFDSSEVLEFIKHLNMYGRNLLIFLTEKNTEEIIELTWMEVKKVLNSNNCEDEELNKNIEQCDEIIKNAQQSAKLEDDEKELLKLNWIKVENRKLFEDNAQLIIEKKLIVKTVEDLKLFMGDENVKNHEILWKYLLTIYTTPEELKILLTEKDKNGNNFMHLLVILNKADVIEFTFEKLKENLSESQFQEILKSKGEFGRNLFQVAAVNSKEVKMHQILWKLSQNSCKSNEEFLKILEEVDKEESDVFSLAACFTTGEIFEFIEAELAKIASRNEIRKLLKNLDKWKMNLLQSATQQNKSLKLHEVLWKIIKKCFDLFEVMEFIKHLNINGDNLLITVTEKNTKEIKDLTWKEVKEILIRYNWEVEESSKNIERCDEVIKNAQQSAQLKEDEKEFLKLKWTENENDGAYKLFDDSIQQFLKHKMIIKNVSDLMYLMAEENVKNHQMLWDHLLKIYKTREELKKVFTEKDEYGNNFIHHLVILNKADVIEFTFKKLKENLSESQFQEILRSKGEFGRNLLQQAAIFSKEVKTHQIFWKAFQNSCKTKEEFLEVLQEVDEEGGNVFHLAAAFTTGEIFEFVVTELRKLASLQEVEKILSNLGAFNRNLLQSLVAHNKQFDANEMVWKNISKYFDTAEILQFINNSDQDGDNLLCCAVFYNTKEIVEFTWNQIKIFITSKDDRVEYLKKKGQERKNLHQIALENRAEDQKVALWVQSVIQEYEMTPSD